MFEAHSGTKGGRPAIMLLLCAGALVVALGLAWWQVRGTRALGEELWIEDTPLVVRLPRGWAQNASNPREFGKPIRKVVWGREYWTAERKIEFQYNQYLVQFARLFHSAASGGWKFAQIGGHDGVQLVLSTPGAQGQRIERTIFRWAALPDGRQVSVEYTPLGGVSHGDLYLLDAVCEAVRVDDVARRVPPREALSRAGVDSTLEPGWELLGPDDLEGPGFWLRESQEGLPVWAMGVFRRGLGRRGGPLELLTREAAQLREIVPVFARPASADRSDGARVVVMRNPEAQRPGSVISSLWVVASSPTKVAVIYAMADARHAAAVDAAAEELAGRLEFLADYPR